MASISGDTSPVHNTNLDLDSVKELPDSHIWPTVNDYPSGGLSDVEPLPVIDLTDTDVVRCIGRACQTWGVFQLTNHGIPMGLIDGLELQCHRLFSLPIEQKLKAARKPNELSGYGQVPIASFFEKTMWSEGFTIAESPVEWAQRLWPDGYNEFCDVMEEYKKEMKALCVRMLFLMLDSLGITKEDLDWVGPTGDVEGGRAVLHLNWYPVCPDPNRAIGMVAHSDSLLVTILYPSSTSGLQVLHENRAQQAHWVTVDPVPGSLMIIVGDLLHILTNGRFRSPLHRAIVNSTCHRISVPCFFGPPKEALISPSSKLIGVDEAPLFRAVTGSEYLGIKNKYFQEALAVVGLGGPIKELGDPNNIEA